MYTPPYNISPEILKLVASISEKIGQISASHLDKPSPKLRKENRIKTIHSSLSIEGNSLTAQQITAILEDKRVVGPKKDVDEVLNANKVYNQILTFKPHSQKSFLLAHKFLMSGLIEEVGKYRSRGVGIVSGEEVTHMAPPAKNVPFLMNDLFQYVTSSNELELIKSCVFHYEMEFIHPFQDGNGRMGRLWQTLILLEKYPLFEFIPFENLIHQTQDAYYQALSKSDKLGASTPFIEYMLGVIDTSLEETLLVKNQTMNGEDRLQYFAETFIGAFNRKDYMLVFKDISSATASRDLKLGVTIGLFEKEGDKTKTVYQIV